MSYGYANYKNRDDFFSPGKNRYHSVTLTGLTPETVYYYRCVSHASPVTIGQEHSFTTLTKKEEALKKEEAFKEKETEGGAVGGEEEEADATGEASETGVSEIEEDPAKKADAFRGASEREKSPLEGDLVKTVRETTKVSGIFGSFGANLTSFLKSIPWWILIIIALLILLGLFLTRRKRETKNGKREM